MVSTVKYYRPQDPAEATEFDAFLRMLPDLRAKHGGQYVAICGGEIVARGVTLLFVDQDAKRIANGRVYFREWVEPPEGYVFRIGGVTVLPESTSP